MRLSLRRATRVWEMKAMNQRRSIGCQLQSNWLNWRDQDAIRMKLLSASLTPQKTQIRWKNTNSNSKKSSSSSSSLTKTGTNKEKQYQNLSYDPIKDAGFKSSEPIPYLILTRMFDALSSTTKRLEKIEILSNMFRSVHVLRPNELLHVVYLCCNEIAPSYEGIELGVGDSTLLKAICECTRRDLKEIKEDFQNIGDLGEVAIKNKTNQKEYV